MCPQDLVRPVLTRVNATITGFPQEQMAKTAGATLLEESVRTIKPGKAFIVSSFTVTPIQSA